MKSAASLALLSLFTLAVPAFVACKSDPPPATPAPTAQTATASASEAPDFVFAPSATASASAPPSASANPAREAALHDAATIAPSATAPSVLSSAAPDGTISSNTGANPTIRLGNVTVTGKLPQEVVSRIIRQNLGRSRLCYQQGLKKNPKLEGRVTVKITIDASGAVKTAGDGGSGLADPSVITCVVRTYTAMSFPQPEGGGIVTVLSPTLFAPGE